MAHRPQPPRNAPPRPRDELREERAELREERQDEREDERAERDLPRDPAEPPPATTLPAPHVAEPVVTIVDEQRARSDEIASMGVEAWKAAHDERDPADKPQTVAGVSTQGDAKTLEPGSWSGSTRSTPPARAAQNPASPR